MSKEVNSINTKQKIEVDAEKRAFMKKFGKYAVVGTGMAVLMTPTASRAGGSSTSGSSGYHCDTIKKKLDSSDIQGIIDSVKQWFAPLNRFQVKVDRIIEFMIRQNQADTNLVVCAGFGIYIFTAVF